MAEEVQSGASAEDLEFERDSSEKAKISLPETIIFTLLAMSADVIDVITTLANILPAIGQAVWFVGWLFGVSVSAIIILWTFLRGAGVSRRVAKIGVARIVGFLADSIPLIGVLPIRTFVLLVTIWLNNHWENKNIRRLTGVLEKTK